MRERERHKKDVKRDILGIIYNIDRSYASVVLSWCEGNMPVINSITKLMMLSRCTRNVRNYFLLAVQKGDMKV